MSQSRESQPPAALELWGGVECSHVRIGDRVYDQRARNGHDRRVDDLDRFAALGLRALRTPVLWERHAGRHPDWAVTDRTLERMRELGLAPIVGLVHHGSGPLEGGLLHPDFPERLADYAATVAQRYPWIEAYTPVNEPATTARFSGLYGIWYPHGRDMQRFARGFMNEIAGTRAAMRAIRTVNPRAILVQTEDLGKTHSTPRLAYQAEFENERRWLTFDLLFGQLTPDRRLIRDYLEAAGIRPAELDSFVADPCPPDILGMNHYVTSERFLDERMERYPRRTHGGNGRHAYADCSAVRVRAEGPVGPANLLRELWSRYRRPIAVTEVQLACTREEQVRWLLEVWQAAQAVKAEGADIRAVTPWALLGSFDWDSLMTEARGSYENGAFDVRAPEPRPTMIAHAIRALATTGQFEHPIAQTPGWWRRPIRFAYPPVSAPATGPGTAEHAHVTSNRPHPPLLVLGAAGTLGTAVLRQCEIRGIRTVGLRRADASLEDAAAIDRALLAHRPWGVVNCAGYGRVDEAESDRDACTRDNSVAAVSVAQACARHEIPLAWFSTDLVFGGGRNQPYRETDTPHPLNHYGRTKLEAELAIAAAFPRALGVRTSAFFGPWDDCNFATQVLRELAAGRRVRASMDHVVSPTYLPDLANATLDLLLDGEHGTWHLANQGYVSWLEWARLIAELADFSPDDIVPASPAELGWVAQRPDFSALASGRGTLLTSWENALERYLAAMPDVPAAAAA